MDVSYGLQFIDSGFTALLISTQPLILIIMLYFLEKKRILPRSIIGVILGMLGIFLLVNQGEVTLGNEKWLGIGAVFVALICWGYGSIFVSKVDLPQNSLVNTGFQMFFGGLMMLIVSFLLGEPISALEDLSTKVILSMLYLITFGSIVAFTAFNYLLISVSPEKVATSTYVNPIVAMLLGWWILDENINSQSIAATILLLIGVYFINSTKRKKPSRL